MAPERIFPDLQFTVLCDDVRLEKNGKLILIGLFEAIPTFGFPVRHPFLHVVNRWCNGEGEFREKTRIVNSINETVVESAENVFQLKSIASMHTVISRFTNIPFSAAGGYWVEVIIDDNLKQRYPLALVEIDRETRQPKQDTDP